MKAETKKLKKKGSDGDRGADGKRHKGEDSEGYIRTDNFVWTDDETELCSAETTTRVIDRESGLSEYADIWCTILYNECGGRKLVTGKVYPQTKREYRQIVISRLKVICHKHWHAVNWKETWPWKVICVYFEWCNVWGGSIPVVQIASKMTSIDQDIAPSESVSGEPYHSSSVPETGRYRNSQQQWYFCTHSTVQSFLGMKLNRQ